MGFRAYVWSRISAENGGALNGRGKAGELVDETRKTLSAKEVEKTECEQWSEEACSVG